MNTHAGRETKALKKRVQEIWKEIKSVSSDLDLAALLWNALLNRYIFCEIADILEIPSRLALFYGLSYQIAYEYYEYLVGGRVWD